MSAPLEDYAMIGDMRGAGLVARSGSLDWLCVPRFDSGACFAAILGGPEHGRWLLAPSEPVLRVRRSYQAETMVLETIFETEHGELALIDCMKLDTDKDHVQVLRVVECRRGRVIVGMELTVRFDYGKIIPWVTRAHGGWRFIAGPDTLWLYADVPLRGEGLETVGSFELHEGQQQCFALCHCLSHRPPPPRPDVAQAIEQTRSRWQAWSARSSYTGKYHEAVQRSLLVLKSLTYRPAGGIVAAPTTSLPELIGGSRNWDYRYCWLRDAAITLYALLLAGYEEEAHAWREWLLRSIAGSADQVQIMYGPAGERRLPELELSWLPGYEGSSPVRAGNAAHEQLQLDVFGELMDAMHQCRHMGLQNDASWALERKLLEYLEARWREPDEGIWEVRGPRRQFTHSKIMAWVAFDRAARAIKEFGKPGDLLRYARLRDEIHADVCKHGYSAERGSFVNVYNGHELDASLLQIPLVGFLPANDPRVLSTVRAIEQELLIEDTFVLRYRSGKNIDGLPEGEGAFLACSFWLVSNYVMQGRQDDARALFERLLLLRNDVGLLAEEYDLERRRLVGNFPQAFSHLALVDAAQALSGPTHGPAEHRTAPEKSARR